MIWLWVGACLLQSHSELLVSSVGLLGSDSIALQDPGQLTVKEVDTNKKLVTVFFAEWRQLMATSLCNPHSEPLDGRLVVVDLLSHPAVQNSLCHRVGVQSLQAPRDSIKQRLVALPRGTDTVSTSVIPVLYKCSAVNSDQVWLI